MSNSELRESFLQEAEEVMGLLEGEIHHLREAAAQDTAGQSSTEYNTAGLGDQMGQISILAHRMRGSAGLYGYPQLSTLAGLVERLADSRPELVGEQAQQFTGLLAMAAQVMRGGVTSLRAGGHDRDLGLNFTRIGGTQQLQELVRQNPAAFRMRAPRHIHHLPEQAEAPAHTEAEQPAGLETDLRQFVQQNPEVWEYFAPEVQEHLASLRQQLENPETADTHSMFRSAHTIKGSSYMVGLQPLGDFAHGMEDLLGAVREDAVGLSGEVLAALESSLDVLDDMMLVAEGGSAAVGERSTLLTERLRMLATGQSAPAAQPAQAETAPTTEAAAPLNTTIRVPAQRLEGLMEQVSALVTSRARLSRMLEQMDELQEGMLASQQRFQRTVRD